MAATGGSNYFIKVKLHEGSLLDAQNKLRNLGNFAQSRTIQSIQVQTPKVNQAANIGNAQVGKAQRQAAIDARTFAQTQIDANSQVATSIGRTSSSFAEYERRLSSMTAAGVRSAGAQLNVLRANEDVGIATAKMTREIAAGQRSFAQMGTEVGLVAVKLSLWTAAATLITGTIGVFASLAREIADVNDAMIGLQRVTGETFNRDIAATGIARNMRDINVSAKDASVAAFEMGKAYGNLNEAMAASRTILIANKVAEIDLAQASQQLVQVTNAFGLSGFQQERVLDKLNDQQNTLGVNIGKTLEATARAAAVTRSAGGTLDQLVARTAVGIRFTGFAPETVARAQARVAQQVLSAKGQAQIIAALKLGGPAGQTVLDQILLPDDPTRLQTDIDKILNVVGQNFQRFSAQQKNAISEAFTGGRQGGLAVITGSLFENFGIVQRQAASSTKSQGSALRELETVLGSVREQVKGIGTEFGRLAGNIERSGLLGIFGALITSLKEALSITNSLFSTFNKIPDPLNQIIGAVAGLALIPLAANKIVPGTSGRIFNPESNFLATRRRRKLEESGVETDALRVNSVKAAASLEQAIAARRLQNEVEIAEVRANAVAANARVEEAFRRREQALIASGERGRRRAEAEAGALGFVPVGQKALPEIPPERTVSRSKALQLTGVDKTTAAAFAGSMERQARASDAATRAKTAETEADIFLARAATGAAAALTTVQGASIANGVATKNNAVANQKLADVNKQAVKQTRAGGLSGLFGRASQSRVLSPGGGLLGGLALGAVGGALQGAQAPGEVSILGKALSGAGAGLSIGALAGGPAGALLGASVGLLAGSIEGLTERSKQVGEAKRSVDDAIEEFRKESIKLSAADEGSAISGEQVKVTQKEVKDATARAARKQKEIASQFGDLTTILGNDFGKANDEVLDIIADQGEGLFGGRKVFGERLSTEGIDTDSINKEFLNEVEKRFNEINESEGNLFERTRQRREALDQIVAEFSKGQEVNIEQLPKSQQDRFAALGLLAGRDPAQARSQLSQLGAVEQQINSILAESQKVEGGLFGDKTGGKSADKFKKLIESDAAADLLEALGADNEAILDGLSSSDPSKRKQALEDLARSDGLLLAFQKEIKSKASLPLTNDTGGALTVEESSDLIEQSGGEITTILEGLNRDLLTGRATRRKIINTVARIAANARPAAEAGDPENQEVLAQAEQVILDQVNSIVSLIQREEAAGIRNPVQSARAQVNALIAQTSKVSPDTAAGQELELLIAEAQRRFFDAKEQQITSLFEAKLAGVDDPAAKREILTQQAQALTALAAQETAIGNGNRAAIEAAGFSVSDFFGTDALNMAKAVLAIKRSDRAKVTAMLELARRTLAFQEAAGISTGATEAAIAQLEAQAAAIDDAINDAKRGVRKQRRRQRRRRQGASNIAAQEKSELQDRINEINNQRASIDSSLADDGEQEAKDLLAARFEFLKALAGGDDVKVARLALQQAKQEQAFAKTQAEKFRARAAVINAERNLRETIFNDKVGDIDFLLQMEKISAAEAAKRLKRLLKDSKLSKQLRQQLRLKIKQYEDQASNDKTFGLPTEVPLPSLLEIKRIVGVGKQVAAAQISNAQKQFSAIQQPIPTSSQATVNNRNNITIVVNSNADIGKVRQEINRATGSTIKANKYMGVNPGLV